MTCPIILVVEQRGLSSFRGSFVTGRTEFIFPDGLVHFFGRVLSANWRASVVRFSSWVAYWKHGSYLLHQNGTLALTVKAVVIPCERPP